MSSIEKMRVRVLELADPNNPYSQEDFDKEFGGQLGFIGLSGTYDTIAETDNRIKINFVNQSTNEDPEYATYGSSGFDLRANIDEPIILPPNGGSAIIPTGLFFELPNNLEIQVRSRSGLAAKNQVAVLNSPGTVDADYRGEVKIILINHGLIEFKVNHGDRIAQGVIASVMSKNIINLNKVSRILSETERGFGGFGSTGIQ